jgi:hypothetical protein
MESMVINYEKGVARYYDGAYREAIELFNRQVEVNPDFPEVFIFRGHSKFILGDTPGACSDWKRAQVLGNKGVVKFIGKYCL